MTEAGFSDENAAAVYRAFSSFLLGYLLLEVSAGGVETGPVEEPDVKRSVPGGKSWVFLFIP